MTDEANRDVCVHVVSGEAEAQQVKSFLLSRGIPCRFEGEALRHVHGFTVDGLGEVRIFVSAQHEAQARELMQRVEAGALELAEDVPVEQQTTVSDDVRILTDDPDPEDVP